MGKEKADRGEGERGGEEKKEWRERKRGPEQDAGKIRRAMMMNESAGLEFPSLSALCSAHPNSWLFSLLSLSNVTFFLAC
jgi:hypothetical protein